MYTPSPSGRLAEGKRLLLSGKRLEKTEFSEGALRKFWRHVWTGNETDCWIWTAARDRKGYGKYKMEGQAVMTTASRISYAIHNGACDAGMMICHNCDNPSCVNPDHLFQGTVLDNNKDALEKQRNISGEGHNMAKLTEAKVIQMRKEWSEAPCDTWAEIAGRYGISAKMAKFIILRRNWRRVP